MITEKTRSQLVLWLASGCILIFTMVVVGGITRLTGSGLSITEWKLISGTLPPLNDIEWQESFEAYKQIPQYKLQPLGFSVDDYKSIYWWEYVHRLLGRLIGVVFLLPFLFFLLTKKISGSLVWKLWFLFALGGLQGFLGWYMVSSGLVNIPHVSHYRLAIHLVTALLSFSYTFWLILELLFPNKLEKPFEGIKRLTQIFLVLLTLQIIYGAFTAGLKSGLFYNNFPKMDDDWISIGVTAMTPVYLNFIEGIAGVQFIHRTLGLIILAFGIYFFYQTRKIESKHLLKQTGLYILLAVLAQVLLGIYTLLYAIPLSLAVSHQIGAFFLLMTLIYALRLSSYSSVR